MAEKDYYSILGVDRNASEDDIKKAYKKLCLQYHPDRWINATEEEKKEAEEKFKEINEANSILSDPEKKRNYDMFGKAEGFTDNGGGFSPFGAHMSDIFEMFMNANGGFQSQAEDDFLSATVHLTLKEAYTGAQKNIKFKVKKPCQKCEGTGSVNKQFTNCPHCNGTGKITKTMNIGGNGYTKIETYCPHCHGTGKVPAEICPDCNGKGYVTEERTISLNFPSGIENTYAQVQLDTGEILNVTVQIEPNDGFIRRGNDIVSQIFLTLEEAWCGAEKEFVHIDGSKIKVKIPELTRYGERLTIPNKGFSNGGNYLKGNLILLVQYIIPQKINKKQKDLLKEFYELEK